jgi:hypothetical protein
MAVCNSAQLTHRPTVVLGRYLRSTPLLPLFKDWLGECGSWK